MKIAAKDLTPGMKIPAVAHERKWMKSPMTVLSITEGRTDKNGLWMRIRCSFSSHDSERISEGSFEYRPNTSIRVITD